MAFDKSVEARLWGVTSQNADVRLTMGDSSAGTFTSRANPLRGTLVWDDCIYVVNKLVVGGTATGGSYSLTIETDAVVGYTGLPIARAVSVGPNSPSSMVLPNMHGSPGSPLPTHLFIDQTATGGAITFDLYCFAKKYRGTLGTPGIGSSERVIQGTLLRGASFTGGPFTDGRGMTEDATFTLGTTGTDLGMRRVRLWDRAFYWAQAGVSVAGTHNVDIIATVNGLTFSIAGTTTGTVGVLDAANERLPLFSNCGGTSPNPSAIIWTEVSAGGISDARVVVLAKTGRGSLSKS
jgi:hypothetical protein